MTGGGVPPVPRHVPVLAEPAIELLSIRGDGTYVDCTTGAGGHAVMIARLLTTGCLIGLDRDPAALALAGAKLAPYPNVTLVQCNYSSITEVMAEQAIEGVDGILLDAGVSSMQIDDAHRGFSFQEEGPLDMRMDTTQGVTARDFLAHATQEELARIFKEYGDIKPAKRLAAGISSRARQGKLKTTRDLADAVGEALHFVTGVPNETRTVFQAIRMAVNDELKSLRNALEQAIDLLKPQGRLVCISFHSGEDRVVKNVLRDASRKRRELFPDGRVRRTLPARLRLVTSKPVTPTEEETRSNPRAHSARLRAGERLARH